jgi:gas vesicle protein
VQLRRSELLNESFILDFIIQDKSILEKPSTTLNDFCSTQMLELGEKHNQNKEENEKEKENVKDVEASMECFLKN